MQSDDVSGNNVDNPETVQWDPNFTELAKKAVAPAIERWFRSECGDRIRFRAPAGRWWCATTAAVG